MAHWFAETEFRAVQRTKPYCLQFKIGTIGEFARYLTSNEDTVITEAETTMNTTKATKATTVTLLTLSSVIAFANPSTAAPVTPAVASTYTLSGVIFDDHNANAKQDAGEKPMTNVVVDINVRRSGSTSGTNFDATDTTDNSGSFSFKNVPTGLLEVTFRNPDRSTGYTLHVDGLKDTQVLADESRVSRLYVETDKNPGKLRIGITGLGSDVKVPSEVTQTPTATEEDSNDVWIVRGFVGLGLLLVAGLALYMNKRNRKVRES